VRFVEIPNYVSAMPTGRDQERIKGVEYVSSRGMAYHRSEFSEGCKGMMRDQGLVVEKVRRGDREGRRREREREMERYY
jgi:hypothetical protein